MFWRDSFLKIIIMLPRTLAIGDIHGGLRALVQLLEHVELQPADRLVFLGDYVDGWSESAAVVEYLMALQKERDCTFLLGNHDAWCTDWLKKGAAPEVWLAHGGTGTIESFESLDEVRRRKVLLFLKKLLPYYVDDQNRLFVHAGFTSMHGPAKEHKESNLYFDRTLWELALNMNPDLPKSDPRYPKRLGLFNAIYIGHTPTLLSHCTIPMHCFNVWNVDTGAAFEGPPTALDIDTGQYWQSDPVHTLYPNERGRN